MASLKLKRFLDRLVSGPIPGFPVWLDELGRIQGRFFDATLTSAFQPLRDLSGAQVSGYEGFARSYSPSEPGLSVWKMLEQAASDDESVALDRLCRLLHALNFFRQTDTGNHDLYLSVDARLLAAVDSNHGMAFRNVLDSLELPHQRIVVQLPGVSKQQNWALNYVMDNYHRNGFRTACNAVDIDDALVLLDHVRPQTIKVDARQIEQEQKLINLIDRAAESSVHLIFKRVETDAQADTLQRLARQSGAKIWAQGYLWDLPGNALPEELVPRPRNTVLHAVSARHVA